MKSTFLGDCHSESVKYFYDHMKDAKSIIYFGVYMKDAQLLDFNFNGRVRLFLLDA